MVNNFVIFVIGVLCANNYYWNGSYSWTKLSLKFRNKCKCSSSIFHYTVAMKLHFISCITYISSHSMSIKISTIDTFSVQWMKNLVGKGHKHWTKERNIENAPFSFLQCFYFIGPSNLDGRLINLVFFVYKPISPIKIFEFLSNVNLLPLQHESQIKLMQPGAAEKIIKN